MVRIASATGDPWATSTSTWRSLATISSGLCLFLDMDPSSFGSEAILQGGPLQRGRISEVARVPQHRDPAQRRDGFLEQLQTFGRKIAGDVRGSGDIAARSRQARDEPGRNRIADAKGRDGGKTGRMRGEGRRIAPGHNHIDLGGGQVLGKLPQLVRVPHCSATLEQYVPAERISTLREIADQGSPILAGVADRWSATE